jgi:subtilisin family serine protease
MKNLLILLLTAVTFTLFAQPVPDEYSNEYKRIERFIQENQGPGKVFLDPIEQIPMIPSLATADANGNWAYDYYRVAQNEAWIKERIKRKVAVFVFDTEGEAGHKSLEDFAWPEKDKIFTGEPASAKHGHGIHVGTCIAGKHEFNYKLGPASILGDNLKLIFYKVLRKEGYGYTSQIVTGIETGTAEAKKLIDDGWFVIFNFSLGSQSVNEQFNSAIEKAEDAGVLVLAAAGNNGQNFIGTPANGTSAHAIGAIDNSGTIAGFSNYGPQLYMSGAGVRVYGAWLNGGYAELSGTSMATPTQAAIAAILGATSNATAKQVSNCLRANAVGLGPQGWDEKYGYGVNILTALKDVNPESYSDEHNGNPDTPNDDEPDEPDEPDQPEKDKRTIIVKLSDNYPVMWKPFGSGKFYTDEVRLTVRYDSKLYAEDAVEAITLATAEFFTNRAFVLNATDDKLDMTFWVRHFYEMLMKRAGYDVQIETIITEVAGQRSQLDAPRRKTVSNIKRTFSQINTVTFAQNTIERKAVKN